jgi:hypothetical protein
LKSIVVMTYYQLMHSIALALTFEEKPILYFSRSYLNVDDELLERVKSTGIFHDVIGITARLEFVKFMDELKKTRDLTEEQIRAQGNSIFEKYLEPHYAEAFKPADFDDEIYVYNDFQWHYYYIAKHFKHIVGVEDGYKSLQQQLKVQKMKKLQLLLLPFIDNGYYPEPLYKTKNVERIISSAAFDDLDDYYQKKIQVWDFKDIVNENPQAFKEALLTIFDIESMNIKSGGVLFLGQPLARGEYCNSVEEYLLMQKYIREETDKGNHVYFKLHPADVIDPVLYMSDKVTMLPGNFPIEVLNFTDITFKKAVTFGSTGIDTLSCARKMVKHLPDSCDNNARIIRFIRKEIKGEELSLSYYIKTSDLNALNYIRVYSSFKTPKHIRMNVYLLADPGRVDEVAAYFDISNFEDRLREYKKIMRENGEQSLWFNEIRALNKLVKSRQPGVKVLPSTVESDWDIFKDVINKNEVSDFTMLVDIENDMFGLTDSIVKSLRARVRPAQLCQNFTYGIDKKKENTKVWLSPGYINAWLAPQLRNRVWHRNLIEGIGEQYDKAGFALMINKYSSSMSRKFTINLYVPVTEYTEIEDGFGHYLSEIEKITNNDKLPSDFKTSQIALTVYDYFDWRKISKRYNEDESAEKLLEAAGIPAEERAEIFSAISVSALKEKEAAKSSFVFQNYDYYKSNRETMSVAEKHGILNNLKKLAIISSEFEKIKKRLKKSRLNKIRNRLKKFNSR